MALQLFLNDLSSPQEAVPRSIATAYLKAIVATTRAACRIDSRLILNCETPIHSMSLGTAFSVATVRNGGECVEESLFLKTLQNRAPLKQVLGTHEGQARGEFEYKIQVGAPIRAGEKADALGLTHLIDGLAVSLPSHPFWNNTSISLDLLQLDADGDLRESVVNARNASSADHVAQHEKELRDLNRRGFKNGSELWDLRGELLPNLRFVPRTRSQIESILSGDPTLESVWEKLLGIDQAIDSWRRTDSSYPAFPFNVRPESRSRMPLVEFKDAAGITRTFSDHVDFTPGEGRIHFIVENDFERFATIGHVGRKIGIG